MDKRVVLGIDPGFSVTGFGILVQHGTRVALVESGALVMKSSDSLAARVGQFYDYMSAKIELHTVTALSLETSFLGKNAQTFLKLGYLRGILYLLAHKNNLKLIESAPSEIKQAVTGRGGASKEQVAYIIQKLFPRMTETRASARHDMTDAVAIALAGLWRIDEEQRRSPLLNLQGR